MCVVSFLRAISLGISKEGEGGKLQNMSTKMVLVGKKIKKRWADRKIELGVELILCCWGGCLFLLFSIYFLAPSDSEYFSVIFEFFLVCVYVCVYFFW